MGNPQHPFSFIASPTKTKSLPLNYRFDYLPSNYRAMCTYCCLAVQKMPTICKLCKRKLREFELEKDKLDKYKLGCKKALSNNFGYTEEEVEALCCKDSNCRVCGIGINVCIRCKQLTVRALSSPWRILPPNFKHTTYSDYLKQTTPFRCMTCKNHFGSMAIFLALCSHENHFPVSRFTCRFCCTEISDKVMTAITRARAKFIRDSEKHLKPKLEGLSINDFGVTRHLNTWSNMYVPQISTGIEEDMT